MKTRAVISLDIGGTNLRMAVVTKDGAVISRSQSACRINMGRTAFLEAVSGEYEKLRKSALRSGVNIAAVGAGVPGLIDRTGTISSAVNLKPLEDFNLKRWLESLTGLPAVVLNDANAAAIAEKSSGAGRPFSSLLHITLGTGVGSGLILDGRLWTGRDGAAAEFGHITVEPNGHVCQCGNYGCLEQYASATAISEFAKKKLDEGVKSTLSLVKIDMLETAHVAVAAENGDSLALKCFRRAGQYLGIACASAVNLLNPEAIIVGGQVSRSFDLIAPALRREIDARAFHLPAATVKLLKGELGDNAGIMGSAAAAFSVLSSS